MNKYRTLGWTMVAVEGIVILFLGLAMIFYPEPYSWNKQFLSALGLIRHDCGVSNWISCLLFGSALVAAGVGTAAYFIRRGLEFEKAFPRRLAILAGVVSGIALAAIGLIPYDLSPDMHNWATYTSGAIGVGAVMTLFQSDNVFGRRAESIIWCISGTFVMVIWLWLNYLRHIGMLPSRPAAPLMQKMIVGFFLCYMVYQASALLVREYRKK